VAALYAELEVDAALHQVDLPLVAAPCLASEDYTHAAVDERLAACSISALAVLRLITTLLTPHVRLQPHTVAENRDHISRVAELERDLADDRGRQSLWHISAV
jgi:hypothetical protein